MSFLKLIPIGLISIIVISFYFFSFNGDLSDEQSIWGAFGDYFGGILNPIIALFVFYYIVKNYEGQQTYFKKQEFENSFFKIYEEFKLKTEEITAQGIFKKINMMVDDNNLTDIQKYKKDVFSRDDYPKDFFGLFKLLLMHIDKSALKQEDTINYVQLIKYKLKNIDLAIIALHDSVNNDKVFSELLNKYDIYENFDARDNELTNLQIPLESYKLLASKLAEYKTCE